MSYTSPTDDITAQLTDGGRNAFARSIVPAEGFSFKLIGFTLGRGGYQTANPVKIDPIVPSNTNLTDPIFPTTYDPDHISFTVHDFESIETIIAPEVAAPICRLSTTDFGADYGLGELGIWAEIVRSVTSSEIGDKFLFAISHFPLLSKTQSHTLVWRVIFAL